MSEIVFKPAETNEEFEQIHRLNHRIFADEIGQHPANHDGRLIDRYHHSNRYFIAVRRGVVAGMVSVHDGPEFSVARRLKDPSVLKMLRSPLEVRLLAILPELRNRAILAGLLWQVLDHAHRHLYSDLLISGIEARLPMYLKMGFRPMGPAVKEGSAEFVPMRVCLEPSRNELHERSLLYARRWHRSRAISLLPGPVFISESVQEAFHKPPVSHRSQSFTRQYEQTRSLLNELMPGMQAVILSGTGTLANDAIASNLFAAFGARQGLVLSNGEFGERLFRHASGAGLRYRSLLFPWESPWDFGSIERALNEHPAWVWAVHLETSTGMLNDLPRLAEIAQRDQVPVAADCVSSLGAVDTAFVRPGSPHGLFLASGVSGKALGAYAGLAFAFLSTQAIYRLRGKPPLCPSFDLITAASTKGPLSTISSPLLGALDRALQDNYSDPASRLARFAHYASLGKWTRTMIRDAGLAPLAQESTAAPTITTFPLPSANFPSQCLRAGYSISHESEYLSSRNWAQIATMGDLNPSRLEPLFDYLLSRIPRQPAQDPAILCAVP